MDTRDELPVTRTTTTTTAYVRDGHAPVGTQPLKDLSDGISSLVRGHLELARAELKHDMKALAKDAAIGASGVPLLVIGYLLLNFCAAFALGLALPLWAAFGIMALVNFVVGAALLMTAKKKAGAEHPMNDTSAELERDKAFIQTLKTRMQH